jgi:hypothetical protein
MSPLQKRKTKSIAVEKKERTTTPPPNHSKANLYNSPYMIAKLN